MVYFRVKCDEKSNSVAFQADIIHKKSQSMPINNLTLRYVIILQEHIISQLRKFPVVPGYF